MQRTQYDKERLLNHPLYRAMQQMVKYMDRYYLDPIIGLVLPYGIGDTVSGLLTLPFLYFSLLVVKSLPLTLAIAVNLLRDIVLGMLPFFVGDVFDFFFRSYSRNLNLITGYIKDDPKVVNEVRRKTVYSAVAVVVLLALILVLFKVVFMLGEWFLSLLH